jgi:hypothetical protein
LPFLLILELVIDRQIRIRDIEFQEIGLEGKVQSAWLMLNASSLFTDIGDALAAESFQIDGVLDGARNVSAHYQSRPFGIEQ